MQDYCFEFKQYIYKIEILYRNLYLIVSSLFEKKTKLLKLHFDISCGFLYIVAFMYI